MKDLVAKHVIPNTKIAREVHRIFLEAFPPHERLSRWFLYRKGLFNPRCKFLAWFDLELPNSRQPIGFTFDYSYADLKLLLFLAVSSKYRSAGYGKRILAQIAPPKPGGVVVLQLEPLEKNAINATQRERRWKFYLQAGFRPSPFFSKEDTQSYATMIRGRELRQAEFATVLANLMRGIATTDVYLPKDSQNSL